MIKLFNDVLILGIFPNLGTKLQLFFHIRKNLTKKLRLHLHMCIFYCNFAPNYVSEIEKSRMARVEK